MTFEQLVLYLFVGGFALLQWLSRALQRRRGSEPQGEPESTTQDSDEEWWNPPPEPAPPPEIKVAPAPAPVVVRPRAPDRSAARSHPRAPVPQRRPALAEPASRHRSALRNRAELRRAIEQMAILGPPRSRAPEDP